MMMHSYSPRRYRWEDLTRWHARDHATHRASNEARLIGSLLRSIVSRDQEKYTVIPKSCRCNPRYGGSFTRSAQSAVNTYGVRTPDAQYLGEERVSIEWRIVLSGSTRSCVSCLCTLLSLAMWQSPLTFFFQNLELVVDYTTRKLCEAQKK